MLFKRVNLQGNVNTRFMFFELSHCKYGKQNKLINLINKIYFAILE